MKKQLKKAFFISPGPRNMRDVLKLFFKGLAMGGADIIPGVSGGTIALITGIYEDLLAAIKSFDIETLRLFFTGKFAAALSRIHIRFIFSVFLGVSVAIVSLARLMNYLLTNHPVHTWSLFFGLIAASVFAVGRRVESFFRMPFLFFIAGTASAWFFVSMIPVKTPTAHWFIFLSGFIAICAMILPGISGAFILLILGKYAYITSALKNPFNIENMLVIIVFCAGCAAGITLFARILKWLLNKWRNGTLAFLTGLLAGSLRKIWPWKETLETVTIRNKEYILKEINVFPETFNTSVLLALGLALTGFMAICLMEYFSGTPDSD
ncbi:MAG: DUF368 domain-containing protein [bacterium]